MDNLVINYVPTGMLIKKESTPFIPLTPDEIIEDVRRAVDIGITSVHLHARNDDESPCWKKEKYEKIILEIREFAPQLVISVSTSGRMWSELDKRADVLLLEGEAKPDMASLTLSSMNFSQSESLNAPDIIQNLARSMMEKGIKPELEVFDVGMINYAKYLIRKNVLKSPYYFNMIFGNVANAQATLLHSGMMIGDIPGESVVSFGGIGDAQLTMNAVAIAMGYGVRVGLEDNIWYDRERTRLARNCDYLERIHRIAYNLGREICTPSDFRQRVGLLPGNGKYGSRG